ncbi:MAG: hypothetical protein Kow0058_01590 [Roseovarius sp.]
MNILQNLLLWLHLVALAIGGAATFGLPVVGKVLATAPTEARPSLMAVARGLSTIGRGALVAVVLSGAVLLWMAQSWTGQSGWFWAKLLFVVLLSVVIVLAGLNARKLEAGDASAVARAPILGALAMALLLLIVLMAVLAFG